MPEGTYIDTRADELANAGDIAARSAAAIRKHFEERIAAVCGPVLIAAVLMASLSPSIASASSQGRCAATAVVASVPYVSDDAIHFDAVIVGGTYGYCYVRKGNVVGVWLLQEEAQEQFERGQPISLIGTCSSDAMAGSGCGGWTPDRGDSHGPGRTEHMSAEQVEQFVRRPRNPDAAVEMTDEEIDQFIYRSRATRDQRCSVMGAVAGEPVVTEEMISFDAVVYGEFSGMCKREQKEVVEVRLERGACTADSTRPDGQEPELRDETRLDCEQFDEAADKLERGQAVPLVGRCTGGMFIKCHQWGLDPGAFERLTDSDDNLRYRLSADETDEAAHALDQAHKLATFEVVVDEDGLGVQEDAAERIARRLEVNVRRCAMLVFRETTFTEGSLTVELDIEERGRVEEAAVPHSDFPDSINECVEKNATRLRFPPLDSPSANRSVQVTISAGP